MVGSFMKRTFYLPAENEKMKIAVVTDTNSGITVGESKELGVYLVYMPFMVDGKLLYDGIDINNEELYRLQEAGADISTSQPSPADVTALWDKLLVDFDEVVHIPMSSGLSSTCQTAQVLAQDYEGRVYVVDNQRISITQRQSVLDALALAGKGYTGREIKEILERVRFNSLIYITMDTLKYLKKGGRVTPAVAALATLLRIKPVLVIRGEKLDAFSRVRTMKQAKTFMLNTIIKDLKERLKEDEGKGFEIQIAYTSTREAAEEFREMIREVFPQCEVYMAPLSLSVSVHIGRGSLAVAWTQNIKELD